MTVIARVELRAPGRVPLCIGGLLVRVRKSVDAADRAPFQPMGNDRQVTPESIVLDPRADSDAEDDIAVRHEAAVPEELIETLEPKRDVQDGTV